MSHEAGLDGFGVHSLYIAMVFLHWRTSVRPRYQGFDTDILWLVVCGYHFGRSLLTCDFPGWASCVFHVATTLFGSRRVAPWFCRDWTGAMAEEEQVFDFGTKKKKKSKARPSGNDSFWATQCVDGGDGRRQTSKRSMDQFSHVWNCKPLPHINWFSTSEDVSVCLILSDYVWSCREGRPINLGSKKLGPLQPKWSAQEPLIPILRQERKEKADKDDEPQERTLMGLVTSQGFWAASE